jgi:hypothetical protein
MRVRELAFTAAGMAIVFVVFSAILAGLIIWALHTHGVCDCPIPGPPTVMHSG